MTMKLRNIMGKRDAIYELSGGVEPNEAFFPIRVPEEAQGETIRRGAGSQRQAKVLVVVESKSADEVLLSYLKSQDKGDKAGKFASKMKGKSTKKVVHYIKMFVLDNLNASTIDTIVREHVAKNAVVITDNSSSHVNLSEYFFRHESFTEKGNVDEVVKSVLPWVHIVIGRCRDGVAAIHGDVDAQFLQLYLNEYCWKFNRRFFRDSSDPKYDLFDRLVKIAALYISDIKWRNYEQIDDEDLI